jgi:uncharacterized membrane protein
VTWLKHILQGRWLGHPLHPALVHLPTGLWPAALLFDALSVAGVGGNAMVRASFACIAGGLLGAVLAIPTGLADWAEIKPDKPARRLGIYHMGLNATVTGLFVINLLLRRETFADTHVVSVIQLTLSTIAVLILFVSGYLGGRMAYEHGIGVGRMSKQKWRRLAEAGHANLPPVAKEG